MERVTIDVISDIVCPWCYLGKARLELAVAEVQDEIGVDINWRPYRLNPDHPPEGVDYHAYLAEKFGGKDVVQRSHAELKKLGEEVGIRYDFEAMTIGPNTLDAHRLLHWAMMEGREVQDRVANALFKAVFEEARDVGDHAVLAEIAERAGLDRKVIENLLAGDADKDAVLAEIDAAQQMGVTGVPFFIVDGQYAVSGAQTPDVLSNALREIAKLKSEARKAMI